jgi:hypothetical protein
MMETFNQLQERLRLYSSLPAWLDEFRNDQPL